MVAQVWPGVEAASPATGRWSAPTASEVAERRPGVEAPSPVAERWSASESSVAVDGPRPGVEAALSTAERRLHPGLRR